MSLLGRSLDKVKHAINKYHPAEIQYDPKAKASVEKAYDILEEEYDHIEEIHQAVHKMRSRFQLVWLIVKGDLEQHGERRRFGKIKIESTVDFRELKKKLPQIPGQVEKREESAHYVVEAVMRLISALRKCWAATAATATRNRALHTRKAAYGSPFFLFLSLVALQIRAILHGNHGSLVTHHRPCSKRKNTGI